MTSAFKGGKGGRGGQSSPSAVTGGGAGLVSVIPTIFVWYLNDFPYEALWLT